MGSGLTKAVLIIILSLFLSSALPATMTMSPLEASTSQASFTHGNHAYSLPPSTIWNRTYGGPGDDHAKSLVQTSDGGYALGGTYYSSPGHFWLVKTDSAGYMKWNRTYVRSPLDAVRSLVQTSDGGYALAGRTMYHDPFWNDDAWLVKTDSAGNMEWNKTYGGTDEDRAYSVVRTGDGGYALAGYTRSFGAGNDDFWLVKTDSAGNMEWNKTYGGPSVDAAYSLVQTRDGGYALAGDTYSFGAGGYDFWLVKTDYAGGIEWNKTYGATGTDVAHSLIQTTDGGYALAGTTSSFGAGASDAWFVKTNSSGNMEWNKTYGGANNEGCLSAVQTSDGGYALAAYTNSFGAGGTDAWLIKVGPPRTISELKTEVEDLGLQGEIDNKGIAKSLIAKLNVAQKLVDEGKIDKAKTILEAFIQQVQNLTGIHITVEAADILIESVEYIISYL